MPNPYFKFKKFEVWHDKCAMKVGTDGVLLGAWADVTDAENILDIGTGTGLISLMLAQRSDGNIVALEIDEHAVEQARENVLRSPWEERITVLQGDFVHFTYPVKFDVIISNPPFFDSSLKGPDGNRNQARHTDKLSDGKLLDGVVSNLAPEGVFSVIIPYEKGQDFIKKAHERGLFPCRKTEIITSVGLPPKRILLSFTVIGGKCDSDELTIEVARHQYTEEYIQLTREYYLKF
ncbi:MAG: methyltransferase [Bacteroides sp.]|nr:methyltransferase [Bacteroides sp.]